MARHDKYIIYIRPPFAQPSARTTLPGNTSRNPARTREKHKAGTRPTGRRMNNTPPAQVESGVPPLPRLSFCRFYPRSSAPRARESVAHASLSQGGDPRWPSRGSPSRRALEKSVVRIPQVDRAFVPTEGCPTAAAGDRAVREGDRGPRQAWTLRGDRLSCRDGCACRSSRRASSAGLWSVAPHPKVGMRPPFTSTLALSVDQSRTKLSRWR